MEIGGVKNANSGSTFDNNGVIMRYGFSLDIKHSQDSKIHRRVVYFDFLGFLGQIGGVTEILIFLTGIIMNPISEQSFILKTIKLLYLARTVDDNLLKKKTRAKAKNGKT